MAALPEAGNPERCLSAEVQTKRPSAPRLPRLAVRRKDLNGDIRDWSEAGSNEMTVDMRLSVVLSQITSSYVGINGALLTAMISGGDGRRRKCVEGDGNARIEDAGQSRN